MTYNCCRLTSGCQMHIPTSKELSKNCQSSMEFKKEMESSDSETNSNYDQTFPECDVSIKETNESVTVPSTKKPTNTKYCEICQRDFAVNYFKKHMLVHSEAKPFACDVCDKSFNNPSNLRRHKRIHNDQSYTCDICNQSITFLSNFKKHQLTHVKIKQFECDVCGKGFAQESYLKIHEQTHSEKSYECDVCSKTFTFLSNLNAHKRTHGGEKMHVCEVCNKAFLKPYGLRRHMETHERKPRNPIAKGLFKKAQ